MKPSTLHFHRQLRDVSPRNPSGLASSQYACEGRCLGALDTNALSVCLNGRIGTIRSTGSCGTSRHAIPLGLLLRDLLARAGVLGLRIRIPFPNATTRGSGRSDLPVAAGRLVTQSLRASFFAICWRGQVFWGFGYGSPFRMPQRADRDDPIYR